MRVTSSGSVPVAFALAGICTVCLAGALAGLLLSTATTATIVTGAALIWLILGKILGGWRSVVAGLVALFAALTATYGPQAFSAYPLALIFTALACAIASIGLNDRRNDPLSR